MRSQYLSTDATGTKKRAGDGLGFAVLPGRARSASRLVVPGSYPLTVRNRTTGEEYEVCGPHAFYSSKRGEFDLVNAEPATSYCLVTFDSPEEGIRIGGRTRLDVQLTGTEAAPAVAVPTAAPALLTDGFVLSAGLRRLVTFFAGALSVANMWSLTPGGVWRQLDDSFDPTGSGTPDYDVRDVIVPARRFYWQAAAASMTMEIAGEVEV